MPTDPRPHVDPDRLPKLNAAIGAKKLKARTQRSKRRLAGTPHKARAPPSDPDCFTVDLFCHRHGLSHSFYYKLKAQGLGPREIKLHSKVLISREAAAAWRAQRERETLATRQAESAHPPKIAAPEASTT